MRTLLLFDGLGGHQAGLIPALRELFTHPANQAYFQRVFSTVDETLEYAGADLVSAFLPAGLPLKQWLEPARELSETDWSESVLAGILVHAYQVCRLQPTECGADPSVVAALGHSIGLQAAVIAGLRIRRLDQFLAVASSSLKLVLLSLLRARQLTATGQPDQAAVDRYLATSSKARTPSPMASVTGLSRADLEQLVAGYNADAARQPISVSLANTPTAQVLSGTSADLLDLYFADFADSQAQWAFLPNTIPFHSDQLGPAIQQVRDEDLDFIGPLPSPDDLAIPVYATDAPRNLQESTDLVDEYLEQVFVRPIHWETAARHAISDAKAELVVDCGPGAAARRFTRECLGADARTLRFESVQQFSRRVR
ncbi:ACP S-malonyltransferase [Streptomyces sp. SID13031]|uniref:ACP S-malonyltransferase n=1 Tax=Streptomyces sp. SID13031 TaxID=2706046 RepID=UPI0013C61B9B|nr:ACP S-malonyltransferase [Streptomyces sp. SID13031]NEA35358.1 ACP S-malonyltransferase [Streptomyces sp. SID13031]